MPVDGRQGYLSPMAGVLGELKTDVVRCDIVQDLPDVDDRVSLSSSLNGLETKVLQALVIVHICTTKNLVSEVPLDPLESLDITDRCRTPYR